MSIGAIPVVSSGTLCGLSLLVSSVLLLLLIAEDNKSDSHTNDNDEDNDDNNDDYGSSIRFRWRFWAFITVRTTFWAL